MIPVNFSFLNDMGAAGLISVIQSDRNLIGTTSPVEIFSFVVAVILAYVIGLLAAFYLKRRFSHRMKKDHLAFWINMERTLLVLAAMAITVPAFFDASLTIVIAAFIGLIAVFALAGQKVITNLICGIGIMYERPFASGDYISAGGVSGTVVSMNLFATMIRTTAGVYVHIPNEQVYNTPVTNYHTNAARRYEYEIGIRYRDDADKALRIIHDILKSYAFALEDPDPEVFVSDLADSSVKIRIRVWFPSVWANTQDDLSLRTRILPVIKSALEAAGIQIPFPQRELWFGNETSEKGSGNRKN
jgi:small-conductance mechanosensitive channel